MHVMPRNAHCTTIGLNGSASANKLLVACSEFPVGYAGNFEHATNSLFAEADPFRPIVVQCALRGITCMTVEGSE